MYNYDYKNQNTNYNCNRLRWIMYMFKKNCQCKYMDLNYSNNLYSSSLTMFIILFSLQIICTNHHLSYNILIQIKLIALLFCLCVRLCCQIVHALFIGHVKYHIYVACLKQIMKLIHKDWMWEWTHVTPFRTGYWRHQRIQRISILSLPRMFIIIFPPSWLLISHAF